MTPSVRPRKLDRFHWTPRELSYLVNLTGCDIVRIKGAPGVQALRKLAQKVHAKLKMVSA